MKIRVTRSQDVSTTKVSIFVDEEESSTLCGVSRLLLPEFSAGPASGSGIFERVGVFKRKEEFFRIEFGSSLDTQALGATEIAQEIARRVKVVREFFEERFPAIQEESVIEI